MADERLPSPAPPPPSPTSTTTRSRTNSSLTNDTPISTSTLSTLSTSVFSDSTSISTFTTALDLQNLLAESITSLNSAISRDSKSGGSIKPVSATTSGQLLAVLLATNRRLEREQMEMREEIEGLKERVRLLEEAVREGDLESCGKGLDESRGEE